MSRDFKKELEAATAAIVEIAHPKKIVVAGAGAGKSFAFGQLLDRLPVSPKDRRLVITFLSGLKRDLEKDLGDRARVQTFHGYCFFLLKQNAAIRTAAGFTSQVQYVPRLGQLIKSDWVVSKGGPAPIFLPSLRGLKINAEADFFLARGSYYDAIGYDDSTVHIQRVLSADSTLVPTHDLVIVDEVQDLNEAEISLVDLLSSGSDVVIAGDDDQALYGKLRDASEEHIRTLYSRTDYLQRNLPFCMRCPSVVVNATNDIITEANNRGLLGARIQKPYDPYPRDVDSKYPAIKLVQATVQVPSSNLFGKYILDTISNISVEEIEESREKGFPTVLIIGTKPYSVQVKDFLEANGCVVETKVTPEEKMEDPFTRDDGLKILFHDERSNLGWRILVEIDKPDGWERWVAETITSGGGLYQLLEDSYRAAILTELKTWRPKEVEEVPSAEKAHVERPTIRMTSFEGAKGMSAQHVFVLGLEDGKFPARRTAINSLDVRRMIVALTRTRKQCYLLMAKMSFSKGQRRFILPSIFVEWIRAARVEVVSITAASFSTAKQTKKS